MYEQIPLIDRAKKDGVKRFIASEFGVDHRTVTSPFFEAKREIAKYVQEASFPDGKYLSERSYITETCLSTY